MPLCAWACGLQFVDKGALGAAATYGLREDIHLVGQEFSWCVTVGARVCGLFRTVPDIDCTTRSSIL